MSSESSTLRALPTTPARAHDRVPPHNLDAETSVLGSMLLSRSAIAEVSEILRPEDFYRGAHRTVYEAVHDLYDRGEPVDLVVLTDELDRRGQLEGVGGAVGLSDLVARVPTAANALYYARIVSEHAVRRRLIETGTSITRLGYDAEGADEAIDAAEQLVYDVAQRGHVSEFTPMKQLVTESFELIEKLHENDSSLTGLATGFTDFDELTAGLQPANLVILAARPAMGKSTLVTNLATHVAVEQRKPAVIFSLEMSKMELVQRILAGQARVDSGRLRTGRLQDADWPKLSQAMGRLAEAPLYIDDTAGINLMEIRSKCRRLKQKHGLDLIIVDYLQLMQSHRRVESRVQEVSELSRGLKILAKELDVPVIALSQLSRKPEERTDRRPQLADLRESGCMPASTRLLRADNGQEITLGELLLTQAQPDVLAIDGDYRLVPSRLTKTFPSGIKPVFRLHLRSGRQVDATGNHRFLTVEGWRPLDALGVGGFVAVPRVLPAPLEQGKWYDDELVLLAHLLGDGSIGPNGVRYATADPANKEAVEVAADRLFGITAVSEQHGRTWQMRLPAPYRLTHGRLHPVREWLEPLRLWGSRSRTTFIPEPIFGLADDQLALFLHHLWATNGSITITRNQRGPVVRVYYASTSRRLAEGVQRALLRFGVRSRIFATTTHRYGPCWNVAVQGAPDMIRFFTAVGCHGEPGEKIPDALAIVEKLRPNPNVDLVPWEIAHRVKAAAAAAGVTHRQLAERLGERYSGSYLLGSPSRPRRFSRERLARIAALIEDKALADLATSDVFWDEILEIEPLGDQPVFDATVEGTHNFIADGVIAHNSIEQDADIVLFIYRDEVYDPESPAKGEAELIVSKHRNGPLSTVRLSFIGHHSRFANMARGSSVASRGGGGPAIGGAPPGIPPGGAPPGAF